MSVRSETRIPIHIFNTLAPLFTLSGYGSFNPDEILEIAAKRHGRDDFGDDKFLEGLRVLCWALEKEANLHAAGRIISKNTIFNSLHFRLESARRWQTYPDAVIIHTHRNLLESFPFNCSLKYYLKSVLSYGINKKEVGEFIMDALFNLLKTISRQ